MLASPEIGPTIGAAQGWHPRLPVGCRAPAPRPHGACCAESRRSPKPRARPCSPPTRLPDSGQDSRVEPEAAARLPSAQDHTTPGNAVRGACPAASADRSFPSAGRATWSRLATEREHGQCTPGAPSVHRMPPFPFQMASRDDHSRLQGQNTNCGSRSIASCPLESARPTAQADRRCIWV